MIDNESNNVKLKFYPSPKR